MQRIEHGCIITVEEGQKLPPPASAPLGIIHVDARLLAMDFDELSSAISALPEERRIPGQAVIAAQQKLAEKDSCTPCGILKAAAALRVWLQMNS